MNIPIQNGLDRRFNTNSNIRNNSNIIHKKPTIFKGNNNNLPYNLGTNNVINKTKPLKKAHIPKVQTFNDLNVNPQFLKKDGQFNTVDTTHKKNVIPIQIPIKKHKNNNNNHIHHNHTIINNNTFNNSNNININNQNLRQIPSINKTVFQCFKLFGPLKPFGQCLTENNNINKNSNKIDINKFILMTKKFNINIIFYNEDLNKTSDNNFACSYFKLKLDGIFYGIDNFNLFKYICHKIQQNMKKFILISSGSCSKKIFEYCSKINITQIYKYYIYCSNKQKYLNQSYPKLDGVFNNFDELKKVIFSEQNILNKNFPIRSSNLIFLSDYNNTFIKLHVEFIRKYSLYKLLKSNNFNKSKFMELVEKKNDYYKNMARELIYNDDEAMIKYFKTNSREPEDKLRKVFNNNHNIQNYISNYTIESFYYKYINKFLRTGNFNSFRILSNHISKFIYHLLEYRKTHFQSGEATLYRKMYISKKEFQLYCNSIGKIICYPSFTSTSAKEGAYMPTPSEPDSLLVKLIIKQNNSKSIICIRDISQHQSEEEYLCLPFTFFKITNVVYKWENNSQFGTIYLTAMYTEKPIEEMFLDFIEKETDNLDPEGLEMLRIPNNNNTTLVLNPYIQSAFYIIYEFSF